MNKEKILTECWKQRTTAVLYGESAVTLKVLTKILNSKESEPNTIPVQKKGRWIYDGTGDACPYAYENPDGTISPIPAPREGR